MSSDHNKPSGIKRPGFTQSSIPTRLSSVTSAKKPGIPVSTSANLQQATASPSASSSALASASVISVSNNLEKSSSLSSTSSLKSIENLNQPPTSANPTESKLIAPSAISSHAKLTELTQDEAAETLNLKNQIKDLTEKLETLKFKRSEDREKLREYEKNKLQAQQLQEFKTQAQEMISSLNKELQAANQQLKDTKDQYEAYKDEMQNHEQRIEEMTVDKELAEAKTEELQDNEVKLLEKIEELKLELEVLKSEIEIHGVEGTASSFQTKQSEKEIETLKAALIKLRDLSLQDKTEINSLRKLNEENQTKIKQLVKEADSLKEEKSSNLIQINELKDQVTATLGSVQMIEQLTEQNLDLEAKLMELKETIADLEEINEVNDQLQENAREEEKELRQNLDLAENRIRESEKQIESLKYTIADNDKTILKFRELVKQIQNENDSLSRQLRAKIEEEKALQNAQSQSTTSTFDFKQKFIETKNQAMIIENEVNKIELQSQKKYNSYLLSYMSDIFLKRSGDNECILTLLFFKRISSKSDLILNHIKEKIKTINSNTDQVKINSQGQLKFYYDISINLENVKLICNKYDFVLNNCDASIYTNIGLMYYDFNLHEKNLDFLIELLQRDQLDESINLESIEKMCHHFQTIYKNYLSNESLDDIVYLNDLINFGNFCSDSISIDLQRLSSLIDTKEETSEIMLLFKEINTKNDDLKAILKKVYKNLPKDDKIKNKFVLALSSALTAELENCAQNFYLLSKTLKELFCLASSSKVFLANDSNEALTAKKLENFAYQVCDKTYLREDNGPYENLRNSMSQLIQVLLNTSSSLENGEFERELTEDEFKIRKYMINSPVIKAAEKFKNTLIEAEAIKYKLDSKEEEIKELRKTYKLKCDELSEQKVRISLVEKKAEDAQKELEEKDKKLNQTIEELKSSSLKKEKEHSDTLEALQQEVDTLQNERRDLKEKLRSSAKKNLFDNILTRQTSDNVSVTMSPTNNENTSFRNSSASNFAAFESPALVEELKQAKALNKILQKNCSEMRLALGKQMLSNLQPLPNLTNTSTMLKKYPADSTSNDKENISILMNNSKDLLKDVYSTFANIKVQNLKDLNELKSENIKTNFRKNQRDNFNLSALDIQNKIFKINSILCNFKPENLKESNKRLVAEIGIPSRGTADSKIIDINMNNEEIKQLLRNI